MRSLQEIGPRARAAAAHPHPRLARRDRRRRHRRRRRLGRDTRSGAPADRGCRANRRDRRAERARSGGRARRARGAGRARSTRCSRALEESLETQRRFVADASHELRTPLTSLQTNIDVLRGDIELAPEQRRRLLDDLHRESQEMRSLIGGLLELARGGAQVEKEKFQFDELVEDSLERARARFPAVEWEADGLEPTVVDGYRDRMERAVWNLLENAGKWSGERRLGRGLARRRRAAGARPRAGIRRRGPAARLRALLSLGGGTIDAGRRARAGDRPRGGRGARRHGRRRECPGRRRRRPFEPQRRRAAALRWFSSSRGSIRIASNPSRLGRFGEPRPARPGVFPDPLR